MVSYYGEEIGMMDVDVPCEKGWDLVATKNCSAYPSISRDFERTPFLWDSSKNAGFSKGNYTWLPVGKVYKNNNLAVQKAKGQRTHYYIYKESIEFRKAFQRPSKTDTLAVNKVTDYVIKILRQRDEEEYVFLFNTGSTRRSLPIHDNRQYKVLVASKDSPYKIG